MNEESIFNAAIAKKPAERGEFLEQACAEDERLRSRIEALLEAHDNPDSFLAPPANVAETLDHAPISEAPGVTIGRYKLREKIGEGGMGVVFVAEQEKPVRRKVALKIIKPGMDTKEVVARFEAERQALAMMEHPNIAKVLDGGATETGRPYFVMELVRGVPITDYCDEQKLTVRERLELFIPVCRAIQHAHQKGIIHRDIKPSNVLVTLHDATPVPKVIDFGVAKATHQRLTEQTIYTRFQQILGTPMYMSPEQAKQSGLDIDTRSDIYSLGVLLYELLAGATPFSEQELRQAGEVEMLRIIRETEPPKPSTKISSLGETATTISAQRKTDPQKLRQQIHGDLDWIVMKALEKDRTRRYETANDFAADVQRFLNHEAVQARPPSSAYRMRKFIRRNKGPVIAATGIVLALVVGFCATTLALIDSQKNYREAQTARKEAQEAEQEARRHADQVRAILVKLQRQLIERAMLDAVLGDVEAVRTTLKEAKVAGVSEDWLLTLEGAALLHDGNYSEAISLLDKSFQHNAENVSAQALLSVAYNWNGDFNQATLSMQGLTDKQPRADYKAFDSLFLGYARIYMDHERAAPQLQQLLDSHPTWVVARAVLGVAWAFAALHMDKPIYMQSALREVNVAQMVAGDNRFVLAASLFAHTVAIANRDAPDLRKKADAIAAQLSTLYPEYRVGSLIRGWYFDIVGLPDAAAQAWKDTAVGAGVDSKTFAFQSIAHFYRMEQDDEAMSIIDATKDGSAETLIAKGYLLAGKPDGREEAEKIYHSIVKQHQTWYLRHAALQIVLLLKKPHLAEHDCRKWTQWSKGYDSHTDWEKESIEFVAGNRTPEQFLSLATTPVSQCHIHFQVALKLFADGEHKAARDHFNECLKTGQFNFNNYQWAKAFLARLDFGN